MRVLITGMTGFIGSHLAEFLLNKELEVSGTVWDKNELRNVEAIKDETCIFECDIRDSERVDEIIKESEPINKSV